MFVARLTKNQDKFLVRIRPHLTARMAWNEATAILDHLARSPRPPFEMLVDLAPMGSDCASCPRRRARARARRTTTTIGGTDDTTAAAPSLQRHGHVRMQRVPSSAPAPRSPSSNSRFAVRRGREERREKGGEMEKEWTAHFGRLGPPESWANWDPHPASEPLCRRGAQGRSGEEPSQRWWQGQHLLPLKPTIGKVAAAQDSVQLWWTSSLSTLAHVKKCGKLRRTAGACE